jgi:NAD(P)H-dependent flavin oxidoreductase YrpB (nitropropane dioxygenase family)
MLRTRFTDLLCCGVPIQLAGMPGVCTPDLVAAVAGAGALGMAAFAPGPPEDVAAALDALAHRTEGVIGANFLVPFLDRACLDAAIPRARVVELFYGDPDPSLVSEIHQGGALASWQVGSLDEALAAADAGCDLVVAQGTEAGGHVRGRIGILPLLDQVLPVLQVPVVAAGGMGSARALAAAIAAGADAVRVGTRFVASAESGAHQSYVEALIEARPEDTTLTETFSVLWPDAPHRVLRSCVDAAQALEEEVVGELVVGRSRMPLPRLGPMLPTAEVTGHLEAMALYAGQSVGSVHAVEPAAQIVEELAGGAEVLLKRGT